MAVTYLRIDNELVSKEWYAVLTAMRAAGVRFNVNEGHRTMERQWYFWNLYRSGRGNLAAFPSANAPHIRTGRIDHAIDFSNDAAVFAWLRRAGLGPVRTVRGESWHIELSHAKLRWFYLKKRVAGTPVLKLGSKGGSVVKLKKLLYAKGMRNFSGAPSKPNSNRYSLVFGTNTRKAVARFQKAHGLPADGVVGARTWKALRA